MNKIFVQILALVMLAWPAWGWGAPLQQDGGTVPSPTPISFPLAVTELLTQPAPVVAGDVFDLVFQLQNDNPGEIVDLSVTIQDKADSRALVAMIGTKLLLLSGLPPNSGRTYTQEYYYRAGYAGERQLDLVIQYTYRTKTSSVSQVQTETLALQVLLPTPTPTPTSTATPTVTPTSTVTLTPTIPLPPTPVSAQLDVITNANVRLGPGTEYPVVGGAAINDSFLVIGRNAEGTWWKIRYTNEQIGWIYNELVRVDHSEIVPIDTSFPPPPPTLAPTPTPTPTATPTPSSTPTATPTPNETATAQVFAEQVQTAVREIATAERDLFAAGADGDSHGTGVERADIHVEFDTAIPTQQPGQVFSMTLEVHNISKAAIAAVIAEWDPFGSEPIIPAGTGSHWFLGDIPAGASRAIFRRLFVTDAAATGLHTVEVLITYQRENGRVVEQSAQVDLVIQKPIPPSASTGSNEPYWLRWLRAVLGQ